MNKIFKLLAILMLFSALSAGSMTVHAEATEGNKAQIGSTYYTSLQAAINAATAEETIVLCDDIDLGTEAIVPGKAITIDLNGYSLKASAFNASGAEVVDSSDAKTGLLKVDSTQCTFSTSNSQVPVYNTTKGGYAFATMTEQVHRVSEMGADTFKLIFKPDFGAVNELLVNGSDVAEVSIGIKLEWTGENSPATLVYTNEMVQTVYGNSGKAFYFELTGFSNVDNLTITPMVQSERDATWSKTKFNAEVEEPVSKYVTFGELSAEDWEYTAVKEPVTTKEDDGAIKLTVNTGVGQACYTPGLETSKILCFQYKIENASGHHGFVLAQNDSKGYILASSGITGYYIKFNGKVVELQKCLGNGQYSVIAKQFDTNVLEAGRFYKIEIGGINNADGSVGIHFKVDDTLIFDPNVIVDTADDKDINDTFASSNKKIAGAPLANTPYFGVFVRGNNGTAYLKPASIQ